MKLSERHNYRITGIYILTNNITGMSYIGQAKNIDTRIREHLNSSINPKRKDYEYPIHRAIRKYGVDNFVFEVLEQCNYEDLNLREMYWIAKYDTRKNGYNQTDGGYQSIRFIKLTKADAANIRKLLADSTVTCAEISSKYNVSIDLIKRINSGRAWHDDSISYPINPHLITSYASWYSFSGVIICQYDLESGKILKRYPTMTMASKELLGHVNGCHHIGSATRGERKSAYGYGWLAEEASEEEWTQLLKSYIA